MSNQRISITPQTPNCVDIVKLFGPEFILRHGPENWIRPGSIYCYSKTANGYWSGWIDPKQASWNFINQTQPHPGEDK